MSDDFTPDQKRFLEGLVAGIGAVRGGGGASTGEPTGPDASHLKAMARAEAGGKKLADQEKWKRDEHPLDAYTRLKAEAATNAAPKPADNFRWRFHGLFHVAPTQDSYMMRLRLPNGILKGWQLAGVADLARTLASGRVDITTRANIQLREIQPKNGPEIVERVQELGLSSRGSGADNIRNVTGDATAGICPTELLDTRPIARAWHHHILNDRSLLGLPRKFNVAFDGGGIVPTLEETNDIGFQAVEITDGAMFDGAPIAPGVWFRLMLGGISGHRDLAHDTGVIVRPDDAVAVSDAIIRVFITEGDRTNRAKARLKYVLDRYAEGGRGDAPFLAAVEAVLGAKFTRVASTHVKLRPPQDRHAHFGVHAQKQAGLFYIGVVLPVGQMSADQADEIAKIAADLGDGDVRLTVWQNLLLSGIPNAKLRNAKARIEAAGLHWEASALRAGLIACTGNSGCKLANANTKGTAQKIASYIEARLKLDTPINIHLTGCPNSCAQHYIGDIGLVGARVAVGDDGDTVEGFHIVVGGGYGVSGAIAREFHRDVKTEDCPAFVERMLRGYLEHRCTSTETFQDFAKRHELPALQSMLLEPAAA
jgi:ferredoxin-nitrite reductase